MTDIFSEITPEPVAAASLGQVYKARLAAKGEQVAVKVRTYPRHIRARHIVFLSHLLFLLPITMFV